MWIRRSGGNKLCGNLPHEVGKLKEQNIERICCVVRGYGEGDARGDETREEK